MGDDIRFRALNREACQTYDHRGREHSGVVEVVDDIELEVVTLCPAVSIAHNKT